MSTTTKPVVYLVDDDKSIRDSMRLLLKSSSIPLVSYARAEEFLEALPENPMGCLLLDVRLQGMDGMELIHALEQKHISLPIILLTGHADVPMTVLAMRSGVLDVIEKPFKDKILVERLRQGLALSQKWRDIEIERKAIAERIALLTRREHQVMDMLVTGRKNKTIAEELGISRKTLDIHRSKVMGKMEARTVADLVRWSYMDNPKQLATTCLCRQLAVS